MALINYGTKSIAIKIVYYGPGLSGKTTNLRYLYTNMDPDFRGELLCLETPTERTLFFDLLPIKAGMIQDFMTYIQIMTVPGQIFYEASRRSVLKGVDGIVFVADSQISLLGTNLETLKNLNKNLKELGLDMNSIPIVFQYNKRDLDNLIPVETFNKLLNPGGLPHVESCALDGRGIFETLKEISKLVVPAVKERLIKERGRVEPRERVEVREEAKEKEEEREEKEEMVEEIEFAEEKKVSPLRVTKVKLKSQEDIDKELENLMKEFKSSSQK
jgi:signal recognition particle receptor subunit beta